MDGAPAAGTAPIFYLPGISREKLRAAEDCPPELSALVELQYRGVMWLHVNGKEWTPYAFLISKHGGLGLDVAKDQTTLDALAGALPSLMAEPISHLQGRRLDSEFFNALVAPDATGLLLRWLDDPETFKQRRSDAEWKTCASRRMNRAVFSALSRSAKHPKAASTIPTSIRRKGGFMSTLHAVRSYTTIVSRLLLMICQ